MSGRTLFDKLWDTHLVHQDGDRALAGRFVDVRDVLNVGRVSPAAKDASASAVGYATVWARPQSILIPAASTTFCHLSISRLRNSCVCRASSTRGSIASVASLSL